MSQVSLYDKIVEFELLVDAMDDDIREDLHLDLAPCTDQEFLDAYIVKHEEKYGEKFLPL